MDYYISPNGRQRKEEIKVQDQLKKQLLSVNGNLVSLMQVAVRPFNFSIASSASGVQVSGDEVAVLIVSAIIRKMAIGEDNLSLSDKEQIDGVITSVVTSVLKRELVFRLQGLSYPLAPKSVSQIAFMHTLMSPKEQLVFGVGPTGTGKTHTAIAAALNQLAEEHVKRIVVTRPHVVEDGEVVTPSVRQELEYDPQFEFFDDIFRDLVGYNRFEQLKQERKLELVPMGHMRGRTFNEAFIIVDEAQNMTVSKMRMAVTRIGRKSRMVITGDPTDIELRDDGPSGLVHLLEMIKGQDLARIHEFENQEIIRNSLVARLEKLYSDQLAVSD